jgi:branched-chain amino acid transport system ATP-binding protein
MLFPDMTVQDNLLMGASLVRSSNEIAERRGKVFALFPQLEERKDQTASTLSGGERRMLAIGRGLMTGARILLLDEPSLGLAPVVIEQIYKIIKELNDDGQTILLVEENVSRAITVSDQIYLLDDGRIAWQGTGEELSIEKNLMEVYLGV